MLNFGKVGKALSVLHILSSISEEDRDMYVECFTNCHEQGFSVMSSNGRKVSFSENRNSDDFVVYFGKSRDFEHIHNCPTENGWNLKKIFSPEEHYKVAEFILEFLTDDTSI